MNRIDRLFAILLILQKHKHKPVTAMTLGKRFEVSERTIYRDMQALMEMGIPIIASPAEGYLLSENFYLPPIVLSSDEAMALFLGAWMFKRYSQGAILHHIQTALQKIEAVLPHDAKITVNQLATIVDFYPIQNPLNWDEPHLMTILHAIQAQQVMHVAYRGYQESEITERDIEPYHLTFSEGAWYVQAYCRLRNDIRAFRLNRIQAIETTVEKFTHKMMIPELPNTIEVIIRFSDTVLPHVREKQHYGFMHEIDDNQMMYVVHDLTEIRNWIFGFGSHAQVISPLSLRQWVIDEAKTLINMLT